MIRLKTEKEIEIMAEGGKILARIMRRLEREISPGISTLKLEKLAESLILENGAKCAFKGYKSEKYKIPYPACLCTSINEEIVHVPPSDRILKEGDILKLDLGILWKGFNLDMAMTFGVGKISPLAKKLIKVTQKALDLGIKKAKIGNSTKDIGETIQKFVESHGFSVIRELCGHGIGRDLHEDPKILNYGEKEGEILKEGMVICIEPMVALGDWRLEKTKDGFGYKTKDNSLTAHFEHTIAITKKGPRILTK